MTAWKAGRAAGHARPQPEGALERFETISVVLLATEQGPTLQTADKVRKKKERFTAVAKLDRARHLSRFQHAIYLAEPPSVVTLQTADYVVLRLYYTKTHTRHSTHPPCFFLSFGRVHGTCLTLS